MDPLTEVILLNLAKLIPAAIGLVVLFVLLSKRRKQRALIRTAIRMQMEQLQALQQQQQPQQTVYLVPAGSAFNSQDRSMGPQRPFEEVPLLTVSAPSGESAEKSTGSGSEKPPEVVWERLFPLSKPEGGP